MRTPLKLMKGAVEDMIRENNFNPEIENRLSLIHKKSGRLYTVVDRIVEFHKS